MERYTFRSGMHPDIRQRSHREHAATEDRSDQQGKQKQRHGLFIEQ
jgi:hypothetical protein